MIVMSDIQAAALMRRAMAVIVSEIVLISTSVFLEWTHVTIEPNAQIPMEGVISKKKWIHLHCVTVTQKIHILQNVLKSF